MASRSFKAAVILLTANTLWMNQAFAAVSETLLNSQINERQQCSVHKKSTNTDIEAVCGYKTDENGRRVKYREFYDKKLDRVIQQYQKSPAVFDAAGNKIKDTVFDEVTVQIETTPPVEPPRQETQAQEESRYGGSPNVDLFARPQREDETDKKMSTTTKVLIVSGAVIGVIGLGYGYRAIRRSGNRASVKGTSPLSQKSLQAIAAAPKTIKFSPSAGKFSGKSVAVSGHIPWSKVPRGARRYNVSGNREVVVFQDPYSNNLLTYMIWNDLILSHPVSYGQPISFSGNNAAIPVMDGVQSPAYRPNNDPVFAQPSAADMARPSVGTASDFVVAARVESERTVTSRDSDYAAGSTTPNEPISAAPAPRDWMDTPPSPSEAPAPAPVYEAPAPAYEAPAPSDPPAAPSDYS